MAKSMRIPHLCLSCRHRAIQGHIPRPRRFTSLERGQTFDQDRRVQREAASSGVQSASRWRLREDTVTSRQQRRGITQPFAGSRSLVEELFASSSRKQPTHPVVSRYSRQRNSPRSHATQSSEADGRTVQGSSNIVVAELDELAALVRKNLTIGIIWDYIKNAQSFQSHGLLSTDRQLINETLLFEQVLDRVIIGNLGGDYMGVPRIAEVQEFYKKWGIQKPSWTYGMIRKLTEYICTSSLFTSDRLSPREVNHYLNLLVELARGWELELIPPEQLKSDHDLSHPLHSSPRTSSGLAISSKATYQPSFDKDSPALFERLSQLLPDYDAAVLPQMAVAAVLTFLGIKAAERKCLLVKPYHGSVATFLDVFTPLISPSDASFSMFDPHLTKRESQSDHYDSLKREWERFSVGHDIKTPISASREEIPSHKKETEDEPGNVQPRTGFDSRSDESAARKKWMIPNFSVRRAARMGDIHSVRSIWQQFIATSQAKLITKDVTKIYEEFLWAFTVLGQPQRVTEVWKTMAIQRVTPNVHHWTAMLEICKKSRDSSSLQSIWRNMKSSGTVPDNAAWTAYISGLLRCNQRRLALQSLEDLGNAWKTFTSRKVKGELSPSTPEEDRYLPSMIPINAAISLLGLESIQLVDSVLVWACKQGLQPNVETFNIRLRSTTRSIDHVKTQEILAEMKASNCPPDIVTFTTLLDGMFKEQRDMSPSEQQNALARVFNDLAAIGIQPNRHTYSILLQSLLRNDEPNLPAAYALLERMTAQGIKPSPHIYTILIRHHFSVPAPNVAAIDTLMQRVQRERVAVDHIFYDRMIEGYGRIGEIEKMLALIRRMSQEGKAPGWYALKEALQALVNRSEWTLCADLVEDVEKEGGLLRMGNRGWKGEDEFSQLTHQLRTKGLLPDSRRESDTALAMTR